MKFNFLVLKYALLLGVFSRTVAAIDWNGNWALACDFKEGNMDSRNCKAEECGRICSSTNGCTHFTWTNYNGGTCWLKSGSVRKNDAFDTGDKTMLCGFTKEELIEWNGNWAFACDFNGGDIVGKNGKGEDCSKICTETTGCTHFSWTSYNSGTCWLKKGSVSKQDAVYNGDKSMICGFITDVNRDKLLWSDEFDSQDSINSNWNQELGNNKGWGNNERQEYTDSNAIVNNGVLEIQIKKTSNGYTSSRLVSKRIFKYGRIEVRAKLPRGRGTWPAIWVLSSKRPLQWPDDGEIDIMEHVGYNQGIIYSTIHCKAYNHMIHTEKQSSIKIDDASEQFHVYSLDWSSERLAVSVDSNTFFEYKREPNSNNDKWPFDGDFQLLLNTAVGGNWGGAQGIDDSIFPQTFYIDYVRHYSS